MTATRIPVFKELEDALHHIHTRIVRHYTVNQVLSYCASKLTVYDLWHRQLAHPGKEVLQQLPKHSESVPEFDIPISRQICDGCAHGKMSDDAH